MGGWRYIVRKLAQAAATLVFILFTNFFLFRILPGDPVMLALRRAGKVIRDPERIAILVRELGLDQSLPRQFVTYVGQILRGDMGLSSIYPGQSAMSVFLDFLWPTIVLVGTATLFITVVGIYLGIRGGWRRGSAMDKTTMGSTMVLYSTPDFWLGMMLLIVFSTTLQWFPDGGYATPNSNLAGFSRVLDILYHLFLPCLTLVLVYIGEYYLVMRSALLDVIGEDYITAVRAKGVNENRVLWHHAVRNAMLPTISQIALGLGFIVGGAITIEWVFSYPGVGNLTVRAMDAQDYALLQTLFLFFSISILLANLLADLLYSWVDPRVRRT